MRRPSSPPPPAASRPPSARPRDRLAPRNGRGRCPPGWRNPPKTTRNQTCWNAIEKPAFSSASMSKVFIPDGKIHRQRADQRDHRAQEQVKGQLHRAVIARLWIAPDRDHQVFGEDRQLKEEKQHEQVQRTKHALHAGAQEHQIGEEFARAVFHPPGDHHTRGDHQRAQQHQRDAQAVDPGVIGDAQWLHPPEALDELVAALGDVVCDIYHHRQSQIERARPPARDANGLLAFRRQGQDEQPGASGMKMIS